MPDALFGIYIHWPFCKAKCPYCDFNSHVSNAIDHEKWAQAYCREIDHVAAMTKGRQVTSIFFGGGTPSLMQPQTVEKVIDHLDKVWGFDPSIEITLEANPTSIEAEKFKNFKNAGVNRVSVGAGAFLSRGHSGLANSQ